MTMGLWGALCLAAAAAPMEKADRLVLTTKDHELILFHGERELGRFRVGLGSNTPGKRRRGDKKTPLGRYRLFSGQPSKYHRFIPIGYPNADDARRALAAGLVTSAQHDAIVAAERSGRMPPQNTAVGGAVGIHGLGRALWFIPGPLQFLHRLADATDGCVLVTDDEIEQIERRVAPGAVIEIR